MTRIATFLLPAITLVLGGAGGYLLGRNAAESSLTVEKGGGRTLAERIGNVAVESVREHGRPAAEQSAETAMENLDNRLRDAVKELSPSRRLLRWSMALEDMRPEQAPAVRAMFKDYDRQGIHLNAEYGAFWQRWAEVDGPAACEAIFNQDRRFDSSGLSNRTIAAWTSRDPAAAMAWLQAREDIPLKTGMWNGVQKGLATADPDTVMGMLDTLPPELDREGILRGVAEGFLLRQGVKPLQDWYRGLQNAEFKGVLLPQVTEYVARTGLPAMLDWVSETNNGSVEPLNESLQAYARHQPEKTVEYLSTAAARDGLDFDEPMKLAMREIYKSNPDAAAPLLKKIQGTPGYDMAAACFAEGIRAVDPEAAVKWAETITDAARRESVLRSLHTGAEGK